jgi:hypothetical protein
MKEIDEVRRAINKAPRSRWPDMREDVARRWEGLVAEWRRAPEKARQQAMQELRVRSQEEMMAGSPGAMVRQGEVNRLASDLGLPPVPLAPR